MADQKKRLEYKVRLEYGSPLVPDGSTLAELLEAACKEPVIAMLMWCVSKVHVHEYDGGRPGRTICSYGIYRELPC